uniref:ATP-dependent zinc metalloprotease FTSH, chloroplastic-like n=1 Tax=Tanacetum cinerariifolium TaxID=118510 RepID=A0A6L2L656_TANCI|nr:ATP-dependent zinc metalloprotease FTSH, chloroplastic-like [Tanacetum cinerariifolium]
MAKTNASGESVKEDMNLICSRMSKDVDESQDCVNGGEMNLVFEFKDCVKGCETDLEMVVDNKEDGEFFHESEEIELVDHCFMNMVKGAGLEDGIDERKQTLHELLTKMEGFSGNKGIIMLDTTSRPDNVLGLSLLRPEKFIVHLSIDKIDIARIEFSLKELFFGSLEVLVGSLQPVLKKFHSHCPQTARMYYHPPADNHSHGGDAKGVNGGGGGGHGGRGVGDDGVAVISTFDVISVF